MATTLNNIRSACYEASRAIDTLTSEMGRAVDFLADRTHIDTAGAASINGSYEAAVAAINAIGDAVSEYDGPDWFNRSGCDAEIALALDEREYISENSWWQGGVRSWYGCFITNESWYPEVLVTIPRDRAVRQVEAQQARCAVSKLHILKILDYVDAAEAMIATVTGIEAVDSNTLRASFDLYNLPSGTSVELFVRDDEDYNGGEVSAENPVFSVWSSVASKSNPSVNDHLDWDPEGTMAGTTYEAYVEVKNSDGWVISQAVPGSSGPIGAQ